MIHYESITFDKGNEWHTLAHQRLPNVGTRGGTLQRYGLGLLLVLSILFIAMCVSGGTNTYPQGVFLLLLVFIFALPYSLLTSADKKDSQHKAELDGQDVALQWTRSTISILDIQRIDSRTSMTQSTGRAGGIGVHLGYGLMVGGGGGLSSSVTQEVTVVGWQLYTSIGIIVITDEIYNAWLNAGKPDQAIYSVRSNMQ